MSQKYKKILFAADLVPEDDDPIAKKAYEIAKENKAELSLVHAVEFAYTYGVPPAPIDVTSWQDELYKTAQKKLSKLGDRIKVPPERQYLPVGSAKDHILKTAENIGADLIIMGSHSRHGLSSILLGSTANGVLHGAKCDVLAVRVPETRQCT